MGNRSFKLQGTPEENFKKLEHVIPRVFNRMNKKTIGIIPNSILHTFTPKVREDGLIFSCCLFAGEIKKVAFRIGNIEGKGVPEYSIILKTGETETKRNITSKRKGYVQEFNGEVSDGDFVEVWQKIPEDPTTCILTDIHISVLMSLKQSHNDIKEFVTDELLNEEEYEGI